MLWKSIYVNKGVKECVSSISRSVDGEFNCSMQFILPLSWITSFIYRISGMMELCVSVCVFYSGMMELCVSVCVFYTCKDILSNTFIEGLLSVKHCARLWETVKNILNKSIYPEALSQTWIFRLLWHLHEVQRSRVGSNRKQQQPPLTHTQLCTHTCTHTCTCTHTHMQTHVHTHMNTCMHT